MSIRNKLSRRRFLSVTAAAMGGTALAACAPQAAAPAQPAAPAAAGQAAEAPAAAPAAGDKVGIRIACWGDVTDKQVYDNIVADFMKIEPTIAPVVEQYPGGHYEKIQANFAANTPADLIYFQGWSWQPFADKDVLAPLDDLIARDQAQKFWPDIDNYKNNCQWYGKTYMSVADTGSVIMFYAKELFDAAEVPYPVDGWTYADFQNAVEKTSRTEGEVQYYGYAQAGGWNGTYLRSLHWMRMNGALEWDSVVEPKQVKWLQDSIIEGLQYTVVDTIAKGYCPSPATISGGGVTVATGRVAMCMEGPWFLANMQGGSASREGGVEFDVVEPPVGSTGRDETIAEVHGQVIAKASKNPEEAWKLMKYIMEDPGQERIAEGGRMCGTPENIEKFWVPIAQKTYNFQNGKAFANSMRTGGNPVFAGAGANYDALAGAATPLAVAWDAMLNGTSAREALTVAEPLLQKILDDYWAAKS
ncbi:MAG: Bacterial extracellular solute-binding protein [Chloroflexi bacterium ADurb.Bin325]|nr:MAG: Bacterial extracellular solute-binding protein [Chloroflexi bacterium ADurb.Bin325]